MWVIGLSPSHHNFLEFFRSLFLLGSVPLLLFFQLSLFLKGLPGGENKLRLNLF